MSKKSCFREPFDKQYGKRAQTLLKSPSHHLYHIHWSLPSQMSWKKSLLLRWKTLGLLINTLAVYEKHAVLNRDNLTIPIQMHLSQKQKTFPEFLGAFSKCKLNFKYFEKNITLRYFVFSKLRTPKTWSDKCLKYPISEDPSTSNMVNVPKDSWNVHHTTFIILIDHCQVNWVGKSLSYSHAESWDCFLTYWLQMKSILFLIETI